MKQLVEKISAYERFDGTPHVFEVYSQKINGAAPYYIDLDGSHMTTAENRLEASEEIEDVIKWHGWLEVNPNFA